MGDYRDRGRRGVCPLGAAGFPRGVRRGAGHHRLAAQRYRHCRTGALGPAFVARDLGRRLRRQRDDERANLDCGADRERQYARSIRSHGPAPVHEVRRGAGAALGCDCVSRDCRRGEPDDRRDHRRDDTVRRGCPALGFLFSRLDGLGARRCGRGTHRRSRPSDVVASLLSVPPPADPRDSRPGRLDTHRHGHYIRVDADA